MSLVSCQVDILIAQISLNSNQRELEVFQTFFNSIKCVGVLQPMTIYFTRVAKKLFHFKLCLHCITFYKLSQHVGHDQLHRRISPLPMGFFCIQKTNFTQPFLKTRRKTTKTTIKPLLCPSLLSPSSQLYFFQFCQWDSSEWRVTENVCAAKSYFQWTLIKWCCNP